MKEEILKIMEMNKTGSLTDDQAAELLAALNTDEKSESRTQESTHKKANGLNLGQIGQFVNDVVSGALGEAMSEVNQSLKNINIGLGTNSSGNCCTMSRFTEPVGEDFEFNDNKFNVSNIKGLTFERSVILDNKFNASNVNDLKMIDSSMRDCQISGSSIDELTGQSSALTDVDFQGTKISKMLIEKSKISDTQFNGAAIKATDLIDTSFVDVSFTGVSINKTQFINNEFKDTSYLGLNCKETVLSDCKIKDCQFKEVKFVNCRFSNLVLSDLKITGLNLENETIISTEQFMAKLK